jgi:sugar lactone lactonase YvrE
MSPRTLNPVLSGLTFLEAPRWHEGRVWLSDFYAHKVYSATEAGDDLRVEAEVPTQPGGLGWLPDGRLLVVSMTDARVLRREESGELVTHADLSGMVSGQLNDMVVARDGHAYVGAFGFDLMGGEDMLPSMVLRVDPDGTASVAADDVFYPNGMAVTAAGRLLVGESFGNAVASFAIAADGSLTDRRDFARFGPRPSARAVVDLIAELSVTPDGCALDADGALWVADPVHARVLRVAEGGAVLDEIQAELGLFACALGGSDGRTLFICAAPDFDENARVATPEAQLLAVEVDVPAAGLA